MKHISSFHKYSALSLAVVMGLSSLFVSVFAAVADNGHSSSANSPRALATAEAQEVEFPGPDKKPLHGFLFKPEGDGPFPALLWNHGSEQLPGQQSELAQFYVSKGYVFFIPHRSGHGRSADAGEYI